MPSGTTSGTATGKVRGTVLGMAQGVALGMVRETELGKVLGIVLEIHDMVNLLPRLFRTAFCIKELCWECGLC